MNKLLVALAIAAVAIPAAASSSVTVTSTIWSQTVAFTMPRGFVTNFENTTGGHYQREAVPHGESSDNWTQMITVTGERDAAAHDGLTPTLFAERMATGFKRACPGSFNTKAIASGTTSGYASFAAIMSCGTSPTTGGATSETAVVLVIAGKKDYYTLQWAARTAPSASPMNLDVSTWKGRIAKLEPIQVI
jgi:hypothetical protein